MKLFRKRRLIFLLLAAIWVVGIYHFITYSASNEPASLEEWKLTDNLAEDTARYRGSKQDKVLGIEEEEEELESEVDRKEREGMKEDMQDEQDLGQESEEDFNDERSIKKFNVALYINAKSLKEGEDAYARNAYNQKASDRLPVDRDIPDVRHPQCRDLDWPHNLPSTSVIICFHNEGRSALLRTVISTLNNSPGHLLREIILVDDFSDDAEDGQHLLQIPKVKLIRNNRREGLMRSRVKGADIAKGSVLTFLDSHCECNKNWIEPLLVRIKQNYKLIASPIIDVINMDTFQYMGSSSDLRGGFGWNMNFKWDFLPSKALLEKQQNPTNPIRTPVIAGGLFSISKKWFKEIGKYDMMMDVWGGENLEISFRVWQCGGAMEIIPCSRVGHVFRNRHPYQFPGGSLNIFQKNTRRAVEVWMDDYKKYYYAAVPHARNTPYGNIQGRLELRKSLGCKSFKWYLNNVYPELRIPDEENTKSFGEIKQGKTCIDTMGHGHGENVGLFDCHGAGGNQEWTLTRSKNIKHEHFCITAEQGLPGESLKLMLCDEDDKKQHWEYLERDKRLRLKDTSLCIEKSNDEQKELVISQCNNSLFSQLWTFSVNL